jgi:hypothetical protein
MTMPHNHRLPPSKGQPDIWQNLELQTEETRWKNFFLEPEANFFFS